MSMFSLANPRGALSARILITGLALLGVSTFTLLTSGCGNHSSGEGDGDNSSDNGDGDGDSSSGNGSGGTIDTPDNPLTDPSAGPAAGNPDGKCDVPADAGLEDASTPTAVVGTGSPDSCTSQAFVAAVAQGGVITFDCGDKAHTITLSETAKVFNDASDQIVIDGGGLITLSGGGANRILYMNTCDQEQNFTTSHCDNQEFPQLTVQNITFIDGNSESIEGIDGSGGAIYASGGRFKAVNARFFNNVAPKVGADTGGGAIRTHQQYNDLPVYLVNTTFGGAEGYGNVSSSGGAISSIGVSWSIYNSLFSYNDAVGNGGNPPEEGTVGGGSGGAIYNDGLLMTLSLCGTRIEHNQVKAFGDAIFFVTNNHTGNIVIKDSVIQNNCGGSWNPTYPGISNHDDTPIDVENSEITGCDGMP